MTQEETGEEQEGRCPAGRRGKGRERLAQMGRSDLLPSARAALTPETEGDIEISQGLDRCAKTSECITRGHYLFWSFMFL